MKKILIIGSKGYLGSRLTDYLSQYKDYDCVGSDIGFFEQGLLYKPLATKDIGIDARDLDEEHLKGFDAVVLLAGISNDPLGNMDIDKIYDPTRLYALKIAKFCKTLGIQFIFPSSCSVYGVEDGIVDEQGNTNPQTPYSLNKLQIEEDLHSIADKDFSPIALRLATVFGPSPRIRFDLVINMLCGMAVTQNKVMLNSDGQAWRPHLHIDDACQAIKCSIDWDCALGELVVLNVGRNDNNLKIIDVANMVVSSHKGTSIGYLGSENRGKENDLILDRKIQDGVDSRTYKVSFDSIHEILPNFEAQWTVQDGIRQLLDSLIFWELDENKFNQRDFYRLQQVEHLHRTGQVTEELRVNW